MAKGNRKARRAWAAARNKHIKRGRVFHIEFRHDPGCLIFSSERVCTCNPQRILKDDRARVLACVDGAGFSDPLDLTEVQR